MLTLAINTASSQTAIAILEDGSSIKETSWKSANDEAERLMPEIAELIEPKKIQQIICIKGPGSFTGLRVGITVANTIAYLNQIPLYAIDTFQYHWTLPPAENAALLIYAGSGGVYLSKKPDEIGKIVNLPDLREALQNFTKIFGDITDDQKSKIPQEFITTDISFGKIIEKIDTTKLSPVEIINPLYIKQPNITQPK